MLVALILLLSYLVGSIPNSIIISKWVKGIDIRDFGSGNAGGTNVYRVLGWKYGILTIVLDALKGAIAVLFISQLFWMGKGELSYNPTYFEDFTLVKIFAGIFAIVGHVWSIFANFKGGKGIATAVGMLLTLSAVDILVAAGVFLLVVGFSKYVSLGSIIGAAVVPLTLIIRENLFHADIKGYHTLYPFLLIIAALLIFTHRKNIVRLYNGNENKIKFGKNKS